MNRNYKTLDLLGRISRGRSKHRPRNDPSLFNGKYPFIQTVDVKAANFYITNYSVPEGWVKYSMEDIMRENGPMAGRGSYGEKSLSADTRIWEFDDCLVCSVFIEAVDPSSSGRLFGAIGRDGVFHELEYPPTQSGRNLFVRPKPLGRDAFLPLTGPVLFITNYGHNFKPGRKI